MDNKQNETVAPEKLNKEKSGIGFRWQYLVIYLLIASVISYVLVDFKVQRDAPSTEPVGKVTVTEAGKKGSKWTTSVDGEYAVPGTIGEYGVPEETDTTDESSVPEESTDVTTDTPITTRPVATTKKPIITVRPTRPTTTEPTSSTTGSTSATETTTVPSSETTTEASPEPSVSTPENIEQ